MGKSAILSIRIVSNAADAQRGLDRTNRNLGRMGRSAQDAARDMDRVRGGLDRAAGAAGRIGGASVAVQALAVQSVAAGKALAPLAGLMAAVPGIAGAGAAAVSTFKVATAGFGDAVSAAGEDAAKFAEATKGMPPAMVSAVRATSDLGKAFQSVQRNVQASFWAGMATEITNLGTRAMPTLSRGMTETATAGNGVARALVRAAASGPALEAIASSFALAKRVLDDLTPAVEPLVNGLSEIVSASADMLPGLNGAATAAERFEKWAKKISEDGTLAEWFEKAKTAAKLMGEAASGVGRILEGIGTAADNAGGGGLKTFADAVNRIADVVQRPEVQSDLSESFERSAGIVDRVVTLLEELLPLIVQWGPELLVAALAWKAVAVFVAIVNGALAAYRVAMVIATGAQWLFNAAVAANPIVLMVVAILAVIAIVVILYMKCEWFRNGVNKVFTSIKETAIAAWGWIKTKASEAWTKVSEAASTAKDKIGTALGTVKTKASEAWGWVKTKADEMATGVGAAGGRVKTAMGKAWSWVKTSATNAMSGAGTAVSRVGGIASTAGSRVRSGLGSAARWTGSQLSKIGGLARRAFDSVVSAADWAAGAVRRVVDRIGSMAGQARSAVSNLFGSGWQKVTVAASLPDPGKPFYMQAAGLPTSPVSWGAPRGGTIGPTSVVHVTVNGAIDPNETARQIRRILDRDAKRDGRLTIGGGLWQA